MFCVQAWPSALTSCRFKSSTDPGKVRVRTYSPRSTGSQQDVGPGGRKIVSMSVGGPRSAVIDAAVREIVSSGIVVVAAAGNDGKDADGKFIF